MSRDDETTDGAARAAQAGAVDVGAVAGGAPGAFEGAIVLPRDPKALEDLIAQRRADLTATIDELVTRAHPREIVRRSVADARGRVRAFATTQDGAVRVERLAAVAGAVVAVVGLLLLLRTRRDRSR
jgi:hypothetical protein